VDQSVRGKGREVEAMLEQPTREKETYEALREARRALEEDGKLLAQVYN
jgi:hypothetical protein